MSLRTCLKGIAGELINRVGHRLLLPTKSYHSFHNIIVPGRNGTTEIDHVIVSPFGVFVIETKHWSGWLFASEWDKTWTRVHFNDRRQVMNPLRQNYGHVMALCELLELPRAIFHSLVAVRGAIFKTPVPKGVVLGGYARHVRQRSVPLMNADEVARVVAVLRSNRVGRGRIARIRHALWTQARHEHCPRTSFAASGTISASPPSR